MRLMPDVCRQIRFLREFARLPWRFIDGNFSKGYPYCAHVMKHRGIDSVRNACEIEDFLSDYEVADIVPRWAAISVQYQHQRAFLSKRFLGRPIKKGWRSHESQASQAPT